MTAQNQQLFRKLKYLLSRTLLMVGAAGFLIGDRFLHEIMHVNAVASEVIGIGGGILVMLIGGALGDLRKSTQAETLDQ